LTVRYLAGWRGALVLLVLYGVLVLPSLGQSLLESHAYRQTQTAYTAVLYAQDGIDFLRPPLPVLGPPGVVPLEFPLFQAIGSFLIQVGLAPDAAMRTIGLASFLASGYLVYLLGRRFVGERGGLIALAAFLFNPHSILYGRTSLIEYMATAFGLLFLVFILRWMDRGRPIDWIVALAGAAGVLLVKITTGPILLLPALALIARSGRPGYRLPSLWILFAVAGVIGLAWSQYADAVRSANPATAFLAARNSFEWFFGTLEQRLDLPSWRVPVVALLTLTGFGIVVWGWLAARFAAHHEQRWFLVATLLVVGVTPLLLFNLYAVHDYYYAALAPFIALAVAMGTEQLVRQPRTKNTRRLGVALAGAWVATMIGAAGSWTLIYGTPAEEERVFAAAAFIADNSEPDDWIVIEGFGWNSTFLYYARRQGFADPTGDNLLEPGDLDVEAITSDPIYGPFFTCDPQGVCVVREAR
jgi:hypothetical protein